MADQQPTLPPPATAGGAILTLASFDRVLLRAGRLDGPATLFDAWYGDRITTDTLAAVIGRVWSMAEYPDACLDRTSWRDLFANAGFTRDGHRTNPPADPLVLWRGTVPERRRDWSWTTDRAVAEKFAFRRVRGRPVGRLYRVTAPPAALLCANTDRDEAEYVVDTHRLRIAEVATDA